MKRLSIFILILGLFQSLYSQKLEPSAALNGSYISLYAEKGSSGLTKNKKIQYGENNGTRLLAVAACKRCMPAMYTYDKDLSEEFGHLIFKNSFGVFIIKYDEQGLIIVAPSLKMGENFSFLNFYTKQEDQLQKMDKQKIEKFALPLLDII